MRRRDMVGLLPMGGPLAKTIGAFQQPAGRATIRRRLPPWKSRNSQTARAAARRRRQSGRADRGDGVTVVDTKNPKFGAPIIAAVKELTGRPVTTIINTHCHGDHVSGNVEFPAIEVIAHEHTAANMKNWKPVAGFPATNPPPPSIFEPNAQPQPADPHLQRPADARQVRIRSSSITLGAATRTATPGSCSRRTASCTPATSSPGTTRFRFSTATTAQAASPYPDTLMKAHAALGQGGRPYHYRARHHDDVRRPAGIRRRRPELPRGCQGGEEEGAVSGRIREELDAPGWYQPSDGRSPADQRAGDLQRDRIARTVVRHASAWRTIPLGHPLHL